MRARFRFGVLLALLPAAALAQSSAGGSGGGGGGGSSAPVAQFNSTLPSLSSGQTAPLAVDGRSRLILGTYGLGALTATPACSTNGTPLASTPPDGKRGVRLYVTPGASITFTIAAAQPSSAPSATITIGNPSTNTLPINWDEDLTGMNAYCTASNGATFLRWY